MSTTITLHPVAFVRSQRTVVEDDGWDTVAASIELADQVPTESLEGLAQFSHAEIVFVFDRLMESDLVTGARHPRGNPNWPRVGIFAQRGKNRPNRLGATMVRILAVEGRTIRVAGLDAIDGTPVVDIKPVIREFLPRGEVRQPAWATELMKTYW
ncbi:MAG TPA: SAM-dependent methyltransferase [Vicinamibacterales bacterium]